ALLPSRRLWLRLSDQARCAFRVRGVAANSVTLSPCGRGSPRVFARRGEGGEAGDQQEAPHPNPLPRALASVARESMRAGRGSPPSLRHHCAPIPTTRLFQQERLNPIDTCPRV